MNRVRQWISLALVVIMFVISPLQVYAAETDNNGGDLENVNQSEMDVETDVSGLSKESFISEEPSISETNDVSEQSSNHMIEYVYIENKQVLLGETENIVVSFIDKNTNPESAVLKYEDESGNECFIEMSHVVDGVILFNPNTSTGLGVYKLKSLSFVSNGQEKSVVLSEEGIEAEFSIVSQKDVESEEMDEQMETSVQVINEDGSISEVASVEEGLAIAEEQKSIELASGDQNTYARAASAGDIVVVLDPGHDKQHPGAVSEQTGINEEVYTLQIAKACRAELQQYNGVEVYMTVDENGNSRWPEVSWQQCLENRVAYAKSVGADLFVSIHLNAADATSAHGVEVFVSNYSKYKGEGTELSNKVISELEKLGLSSRGVKVDTDYRESQGDKYDDGNWVDDLSVIRNSTLSGFPSILIEHGFLTNGGDASIIKSKANEIGQADAKAIADHLNLTKGAFGVSPSREAVAGNTVVLKAYPKNIESGYNQYRFIYYDGINWKAFNDFSENTSYEWIPNKAGESYILGMEAKNGNGDVKQYIIWNYYKIVEPEVSIRGVAIKEKKNGMVLELEPMVETNSDSLKYTYQIYDVDRNVWMTIKSNTLEQSAEWELTRSGTFWIHIVAVTPLGKEYSYTMGYGVDADRAYIEQFSSSKETAVVGESVKLTAEYKALEDEKVNHQFLIYDGQYWEDITGSSKKETTWIPKKSGSYLLCYQIILKSGKVYQSFLSMEVTGSDLELKGMNAGQINSKGEIKLSADVVTKDPGVTYTFKAYDMEKWENIVVNSPEKEAIWYPKKTGDHLLYLEVRNSEGREYTYAMGYAVPKLVEIKSFHADKNSPQGVGNKITLSADVAIPSTLKATYEYMYYDGKKWNSISKADSLQEGIWTPKSGNDYLLCFQIVTETGEVYQSFMGYTITEPYVQIQGIHVGELNSKGEISLSAVVNTNDENLKYTYKEYDMKNWRVIREQSSEKTAVWKPEKAGNFLLYLEVEGSTGKTFTYCMGCAVEGNLKITGMKKTASSPQATYTDIVLEGQISTLFTEGLRYEYLAYDGNYWSTISSSNNLEKAIWTPTRSGNYLLCFQVINKDGKVIQWFDSYQIEDVKVEIKSITVGDIDQNKQVSLKANVSTNTQKLRYTFKAYDMKNWKNIIVDSEKATAEWNVEKEGTYLLYLEVKDRAGKSYTYSMGCTIENNIVITGFSTDLQSPQKINDDLYINLLGIVKATYMQGLKFRYLYYDGVYWNSIAEMENLPSEAKWRPKKPGDYLLCFQVETESGRQINQFMSFTISDYYYIMGNSSTTVPQMVAFFNANNANYDKYSKVSGYDGVLALGGAATINDFCSIFAEEAAAEGVKAEVAFCQAMLETGFLQYGGDVKPDQYNFAGLGATGGGEPGNRFKTVREGIRAQIQHLKCYEIGRASCRERV